MGVSSHFFVVWVVTMPTGQGWHLGKFQLYVCVVCVSKTERLCPFYSLQTRYSTEPRITTLPWKKKKKKNPSHTHGRSAHRHACAHTHHCTHTHTDRWGEQSVSADKLNNRSVCFFLPPLSSCFLQMSDFTCLPEFLLFFHPSVAITCASNDPTGCREEAQKCKQKNTKPIQWNLNNFPPLIITTQRIIWAALLETNFLFPVYTECLLLFNLMTSDSIPGPCAS